MNAWSWVPTILLWFINIIIFGGCLVKLLVYGDPVIDSQSEETKVFWKHKKQSDYYIDKVKLTEIISIEYRNVKYLFSRVFLG